MFVKARGRSKLVALALVLDLAGAAVAFAGPQSERGGYYRWFLDQLEVGKRHRRQSGRGVAIYSPVDSPDRPPFNYPSSWNRYFTPYYSRMIPSSARWYSKSSIPYYRGFCKSGPANGEPNCLNIPAPEISPAEQPSGVYGWRTGAPQDESKLLHLGGEGPYQGTFPDIIGGNPAGGAEQLPTLLPAVPLEAK